MSWFGNRQKNSRSQRRLNYLKPRVKVRSDELRRNRRLILGAALTVLSAGLLWGGWEMAGAAKRKFFSANPQFLLKTVEVQNDGTVLSREEILRHAAVPKGLNLFQINLKKVRADLELLPQVRRVEVRRQIPDRLVIRVEERVPIARLTSQRGLQWETYSIDREGYVMPLDAGGADRKPLITGAPVGDLRVGSPVTSPEVFEALDLIQKCEITTLNALLDIDSVDVSRSHLLLLTASDGMRAKIGVDFKDQNLRRLEFILNDARLKGLRVATADLTVDRDVPVIFRRQA